MKTILSTLLGPMSRVLLLTITLVMCVSCDDRPRAPSEAIKDGLDARPHENIKDAGENIKDAAKDLTK